MDGYVFIDAPRSGEENMRIDRQLLETAERQRCAFVRLYRWSPATLSLGHFQAGIDRSVHAGSASMPSVLRTSGGGAIVHDHEWTYSIAMPVGRNKIGAATELYDVVHASLVAGLRALGWDASLWSKACQVSPAINQLSTSTTAQVNEPSTDSPSTVQHGCGAEISSTEGYAPALASSQRASQRPEQPFLCFARRSCGDIVCEGYKIVGSAQRRQGSSVLQHGSLLWHTSRFAQEIKGLSQLPRRLEITSPEANVVEAFLANPSSQIEPLGNIMLSWLLAPLVASFPMMLRRLTATELLDQLAADGHQTLPQMLAPDA